MQYKEIVVPGVTMIQIVLGIVALLMMYAFALDSSNPAIFTNILLIILIIVQLFTVNILISVYNKFGGKKK